MKPENQRIWTYLPNLVLFLVLTCTKIFDTGNKLYARSKIEISLFRLHNHGINTVCNRS